MAWVIKNPTCHSPSVQRKWNDNFHSIWDFKTLESSMNTSGYIKGMCVRMRDYSCFPVSASPGICEEELPKTSGFLSFIHFKFGFAGFGRCSSH